MVVPGLFVVDGDAKILAICFWLKNVAVKMVLEIFWRFASGNTEDAAFWWVKLHLPLLLP